MNRSPSTRRLEDIPPTGLTTLFDPPQPSLDIVFLHGFTGHPKRTWTQKKGDTMGRNEENDDGEPFEPPSKVQRLSLFHNSHHQRDNSTSAVYWPRDLLPETIPYARILTYGYDTHMRHCLGPSGSNNTVYDIAWDCLVALEAERRVEPSRPVLFMAHSLGGIIVKEMLRRSSGCKVSQPHLGAVFDSTLGIIFFGTPHGGADPRGFLLSIAKMVIKAAGFSVNEQIVNTLLPSAERLRELRDEFSPMANQQDWMIHSFQEQLCVKYLGCKVVEDTSSYLNFPSIETTQHIARNHMEMCRFTGPDDIEYKKVVAALHRMTAIVSKQPRRQETPSLSEEQRQILVDSMRFDQIDARQMTIKSAHTKTCKWLLKKDEYLDWLDAAKLHQHHGFLWIKGKPGSGKSTIMKFALASFRKRMKDRIIISFFFNARGAELEKSTIGMYRSLLLQLLERLPELQCVFDSLGFGTWNSSTHHEWSVELLKDLFGQAILKLGQSSVTCFIDALDECDEGQIRDMMTFFQHLGELAVSAGIQFNVCFSSRHYPSITVKKGINLVLEGQEGHTQDITNYIDSELTIGHSKLAEQIRVELQDKASGVFMWAVLVVEILNKEHDRGRIYALRRRLQEIPGNLHELFRDILTRDCHDRNELLVCIQWLLFARQPLKPEELYFAILYSIESESPSKWDANEVTKDTIQRFILNSSKGLAEVTKSKIPVVQFIHESVRDFLLKENGLREVWCDLGSNFQGHSHERLKQCCLNYMSIDIAAHLNIGNPLPKASSQEALALRKSVAKSFPFLEYAVRNVLYHADAAEWAGINQNEFFQRLQLADWIKLNNLFERHEVRRYTPNASILYILAERNMSSLIRIHPSNISCFKVEDERYGLPFFAALATGSGEAVQTFLEVQAEIHPPLSPLHGLCKQFCQDTNKWTSFGRDFTFSRRRNILSCVAEHGDEILLAFLLETEEYMPDAKDSAGRTPLSRAAENGYETVVKLLLATGKVDADSKDNIGRTPLSWAAGNGHEAVAKLLLATSKVNPDLRDDYGRTPLSRAAENGREAVVNLLLTTSKVDADSRANFGRTPLFQAAWNGHEIVVNLLLTTGKVDAGSRDNDDWTPLLGAAQNGNEAIINLLLATGKVDADLKNKHGRTPLSWAAGNGKEAVVKLLLATNKVNANSRDNDDRTPLSWAAENGHEAVVNFLLTTGKVDADSRDNIGRTPLSWAAGYGHEAVVNLLLATGKVDADLKNKRGRTPLSWAAGNGNEAVKLLLATSKVNANSRDNNGWTPLIWATENRHEAIVKLLQSPLGL